MSLATGLQPVQTCFHWFLAVVVAVAKNFDFVATATGPVGPNMVKKPDPTGPANSSIRGI